MDSIRTTDHIQSRPGFFNQNTAPRDLSQPITNLSKVKGAAQPGGRANATDTPPPSLIARMAKGVLANQRRQLERLPSGSRDRRMAEHYKASYVLEDRGGATAPGAELSLRPTGKAAGGMDNPRNLSKRELQQRLSNLRRDIEEAQQEQQRHMALADSASSAEEWRDHIYNAQGHRVTELERKRQYDAITWELEARSGRSGGGSRF